MTLTLGSDCMNSVILGPYPYGGNFAGFAAATIAGNNGHTLRGGFLTKSIQA
jgi:hypothetical protein